MILVSIVVSCFVGTFAGLGHVVFLNASVWQGVTTYFATSVGLCVLVMALSALRRSQQIAVAGEETSIAQWEEWHSDEDFSDAERESVAKDAPHEDFRSTG